MAVLGAFLGALGVSDLFRAADDDTSPRRRFSVLAVGLATLALLLVACGITGITWLTVGLPLAAALTAWTLGSADSLARETTPVARSIAFTGLATGIAISLLLGGNSTSTWPTFTAGPLAAVPFDRTILVVGVGLVQVATANVIVRLVLEGVGVPTAPGEKKLRSGRVLGPMERLFILGLGMSGSITAAAAVVAAKGLLRYPELKAGDDAAASAIRPNALADSRPNPVSEYFLIGSFASWLVAVAALGLVELGA